MPETRITLKHGALQFSADVCGSGPVVLLLHGFPDSAESFRAQLPVLAEAGFQAVAVTLPGYEPGSQHGESYAQETLAAHVIAMASQFEGPVHLVGHDWGAVLVYLAAALAPKQFASVTAIAVPHGGRFLAEVHRHPRQLWLSRYMMFFQLPKLPERRIRRPGYPYLRKLWHSWSPGWAFSDEDFAPVAATFDRPGVLTAALAYYRDNLAPARLLQASKQGFQVPVRTLCVTGADDGCIDSRVFEALTHPEDFPAGLEFARIEDAGHWPHREQAPAFNRLLLQWLCSPGEGGSD